MASRKRDAINLVALTAIQVSNAALPLFVFPFTLKVVGAGMYAKVALAEAIALLGVPLVLFSFDVDGVSRIVGLDVRAEIDRISRVFSGVLYVRLVLYAVCLVAAAALWPFLDPIVARLLLAWLLVPLSHVVQSFWLFQGLERNAPVAAFTVVSRLLGAVLVTVLVRTPADVYRMPLIVGAVYVGSAVLSLGYAVGVLRIRLHRVPVAELAALVRGGKEIFLGNLSVILYRDANVLLLGAVAAGDKAIAAYSIAEKLIKGLQASMRPLNQLFFPKALRALRAHREADGSALKTMLKMTVPQWAALAVVTVGLFVGYGLLQGRVPVVRDFPNRELVARYMAVMVASVFFGIGNFMLGTAGLNYLEEKTYYFRVILAVGIANAILCSALSAWLGGIGAALSFGLAESLLFCAILARYRSRSVAAAADPLARSREVGG